MSSSACGSFRLCLFWSGICAVAGSIAGFLLPTVFTAPPEPRAAKAALKGGRRPSSCKNPKQNFYPAHISQTLSFTHKAPRPDEFSSSLFPDCALVGSGASLRGHGLGPTIDAHCPVIRVNRLPTKAFFGDFGRRTHLLFGNSYEAEYNVSLMSDVLSGPHCHANSSDPLCYPGLDCRTGPPGCPSAGIFFDSRFRCPRATISWKKAPMAVGCSSSLLRAFVRFGGLNKAYRGEKISTGMIAFLAFAPQCQRITLYGFSGRGAADGHAEAGHHSFQREHAVYRSAVNRNISVELLTGNTSRQPHETKGRHKGRVKIATWLSKALQGTKVKIVQT